MNSDLMLGAIIFSTWASGIAYVMWILSDADRTGQAVQWVNSHYSKFLRRQP